MSKNIPLLLLVALLHNPPQTILKLDSNSI